MNAYAGCETIRCVVIMMHVGRGMSALDTVLLHITVKCAQVYQSYSLALKCILILFNLTAPED
jgi:hypothetical protein